MNRLVKFKVHQDTLFNCVNCVFFVTKSFINYSCAAYCLTPTFFCSFVGKRNRTCPTYVFLDFVVCVSQLLRKPLPEGFSV